MAHIADLPFAAPFDALAFIVEAMRTGHTAFDRLLGNRELVPALGIAFNSCSWDATGIKEVIPYEHFKVGWHRPETITDYGFQQVDVWGRTLFVHSETLARLEHKLLVLKQEKRRQVLIAVKL